MGISAPFGEILFLHPRLPPMNRLRSLAVAASLLYFPVAMISVQAADSDLAQALTAETFEAKGGGKLNYRFLQPKATKEGEKYPLVIFLHGAGERGDDNAAQLKHGVGDFVKRADSHPCYLIAPQCPREKRWVEVDWSAPSHDLPEEAGDQMAMIRALIDEALAKYPIDANRIYITGLSMGGYGTWDAVARYPDLFAAAAPICGGGDPKHAKIFAKLPLWCFHGDEDQAVPVARSRAMIEALKAAGGEPKYTEYPGVGHDSWSRSYADDAFLDWLFAQKMGS